MGACLAEIGRGSAFAVFAVPAGTLLLFLVMGFGFWAARQAESRHILFRGYPMVAVPLILVGSIFLIGVGRDQLAFDRSGSPACQASATLGLLASSALGLSIATLAGLAVLAVLYGARLARSDRRASLTIRPVGDAAAAYRGTTLFFQATGNWKRPFLIYVFGDGLIVLQPPLESPTIA